MIRANREKKAQALILNDRGVDYIIDCYSTPDYVQCVCSIGGDTVTYRVYDNGTITEK